MSGTTRRVDFLIAGAQKSGTTALDDYLRRHPEICMADRKELHFFDDEQQFARGEPDYEAYHRHFQPTRERQRLGEATPIYMFWDPAPERIRSYNPDIKLIIVLRNPITRAFSHWHMERGRGREPLEFSDAIRAEEIRLQEGQPDALRTFSYAARGFYSRQIRRLWSLFPRNQTLVLKSEMLRERHRDALRLIERFLALEPFPDTGALTSFVQDYSAGMVERDWFFLRDTFRQEIRDIEDLLGWDCADWLYR